MGICIFGQGDCGAKAETIIKNQNTQLNSVVSNIFTTQLQKHQAGQRIIQNVSIEAVGDVTIEDIDLKNIADVDLKSQQTLKSSENITDILNTAVDNLVDSQMKTVSGFLSGSSEAKYSSELKNVLKNEIQTNINLNQISECVGELFIEQKIQVKSGGNVIAKGIRIENTSKLAANCVTEQIGDIIRNSAVVNKVVNDINTEIEATARGPFESLGEFFFGTAGGIIVFILLILLFGAGVVVASLVIYRTGGQLSP